jgi:hypothetical protein
MTWDELKQTNWDKIQPIQSNRLLDAQDTKRDATTHTQSNDERNCWFGRSDVFAFSISPNRTAVRTVHVGTCATGDCPRL